MLLCTMISMLLDKTITDGHAFLNTVRRIHKAGFSCVDPVFQSVLSHQTEMPGDNWREEADLLLNEAAKLNVSFPQIHLPYPQKIFSQPAPDAPGCEKTIGSLKS